MEIGYNEAAEKAEALSELMGYKWMPYVWNNLGWHYSAVSKDNALRVMPKAYPGFGYVAHLGRNDEWTGEGETPREAVSNALNAARAELKALKKLLSNWKEE